MTVWLSALSALAVALVIVVVILNDRIIWLSRDVMELQNRNGGYPPLPNPLLLPPRIKRSRHDAKH